MLDRYLRVSVALLISFVLPLAAADKSKAASANSDQPAFDQPQPRVETWTSTCISASASKA